MKSKSSQASLEAKNFERFIHKNVPLTKKMGLKVEKLSRSGGVRLRLPLKPNRNHKKTAFGGSLVGAQAVACWAWLWHVLRQEKISAEVVLKSQNSEISLPVTRNFHVVAKPASNSEMRHFLETIRRHKKARLQVTACVYSGTRVASRYVGEYVAIRDD